MAGWAVAVQLLSGEAWTSGGRRGRGRRGRRRLELRAARGRRGRLPGPGRFLLLGSASIFGAAFPVVLPPRWISAFDLTISNASSSDYTLGLMSIVAAVGLPLVLAYQAWTYWVFRRRVSAAHIPEAHSFLPAIAAKALAPKD